MSETVSAGGAYGPEMSCKDSFRYRLVGENGRYRFVSVKFVGTAGCPADDLEEVAAMLRGKWLDEIDIEALSHMACRDGREGGCPQEVAKMVADIQQALLTVQDPRTRQEASRASPSARTRLLRSETRGRTRNVDDAAPATDRQLTP